MVVDQVLRKARRSLGSRTNRRANTNGKIRAEGATGKSQKKASRRNPVPVKSLSYKLWEKVKEMLEHEG